MRLCSNCSKADRPILDVGKACGCGVEPDPLLHDPNCRSLSHTVVHHLVRIAPSDLTTAGELSLYYKGLDWKLRRDGERFYRGKLLCVDCVVAENDALDRQREYKRACRDALGLTDQTYAQMLAQTT